MAFYNQQAIGLGIARVRILLDDLELRAATGSSQNDADKALDVCLDIDRVLARLEEHCRNARDRVDLD